MLLQLAVSLAECYHNQCYFCFLVPSWGPLVETLSSSEIDCRCIDFYLDRNSEKMRCLIKSFDTVVFNTMDLYPLIESLVLSGEIRSIRSYWIVHESQIDGYLNKLLIKKTVLESLDRLIFVSNETRKLYERVFGSLVNSQTIHNGISVKSEVRNSIREAYKDKRLLRLSKDKLVVLTVGTVTRRKGQLDLVKFYIKLMQSGIVESNVVFVIVGFREDGYSKLVKETILRSEFQKQIVAVDESEDIDYYYRISDIFLFHSYCESFPLVVIEAMSFGLPVIAANVYGVKEQIKNGEDGLLYKPGCWIDLMRGLLSLLENHQLRSKLGEAAKAKCNSEFSHSKMMEKYWKLLCDAI